MKATDMQVEQNPWSEFNKNQTKYSTPQISKSLWQIANTFIPYVGVWILMIYSMSISYWITAFLAIIAAGWGIRLLLNLIPGMFTRI